MRPALLKTLIVCCTVAAVSCSTYSTRTELSAGKPLKSVQSFGILLRLPANPRIPRAEIQENISQWLSPAKQMKKTILVDRCDEALCAYGESNRFFQLSDDNSTFLSFKSRGVLNLYLRQNEAALKKIMADNALEGLIIYEVYPVLSFEMQFLDFESVICIVDRELNVLFIDRQSDRYEADEINMDKMKKSLMDRISERLLLKLTDLGIVKV